MAGSLPLRSSRLTSRRRSTAASGVLIAAWTVGTSSYGNTNRVRRMAIQRTRLRRSYIAADTSATVDPPLRARTDRYTEAGSVACRPSSARATASGPSASPPR